MRKIDKESTKGKVIRALGFGIGITFALANRRTSYKMTQTLVKEIFGLNAKPKNLHQTFYRLRKQKLISFEEKGDICKVVLTESGREILLKFNYDELKIKKPKIWDGQFRLIIFDIPEKKRKARDSLREKLRELGCVRYNDSVWVYPFPCQNEVDFIANYWGVGRYVQFVLAKDLTNKEKLEDYFKL